MPRRFRDRHDAGRQLAASLAGLAGTPGLVVLGLPRGGVPVAAEVAAALGAPLDVVVVRKLGVPGHEELAMGAIASGGARVLNEELVRNLGLPAAAVAAVEARERDELARRERRFRGDRPPPDLRGATVLLVDDGLATGSTMRAAALAVRQAGAARVVGAVPVGAASVCEEMREAVDEMRCLVAPEQFLAVGTWYDDFRPTADADVHAALADAARPRGTRPPGA